MLQNYRESIFCGIILVIMSKQKKKRNKKYTGADASTNRPSITRVSAVQRSALSQWLFDHKRTVKFTGIAIVVVLVIVLIVSGIMSLF